MYNYKCTQLRSGFKTGSNLSWMPLLAAQRLSFMLLCGPSARPTAWRPQTETPVKQSNLLFKRGGFTLLFWNLCTSQSMRSPVLTPPLGMLCVSILAYISMCSYVVGLHFYAYMCQKKSSSKFICISLMQMTAPPKHGKKTNQ